MRPVQSPVWHIGRVCLDVMGDVVEAEEGDHHCRTLMLQWSAVKGAATLAAVQGSGKIQTIFDKSHSRQHWPRGHTKLLALHIKCINIEVCENAQFIMYSLLKMGNCSSAENHRHASVDGKLQKYRPVHSATVQTSFSFTARTICFLFLNPLNVSLQPSYINSFWLTMMNNFPFTRKLLSKIIAYICVRHFAWSKRPHISSTALGTNWSHTC